MCRLRVVWLVLPSRYRVDGRKAAPASRRAVGRRPRRPGTAGRGAISRRARAAARPSRPAPPRWPSRSPARGAARRRCRSPGRRRTATRPRPGRGRHTAAGAARARRAHTSGTRRRPRGRSAGRRRSGPRPSRCRPPRRRRCRCRDGRRPRGSCPGASRAGPAPAGRAEGAACRRRRPSPQGAGQQVDVGAVAGRLSPREGQGRVVVRRDPGQPRRQASRRRLEVAHAQLLAVALEHGGDAGNLVVAVSPGTTGTRPTSFRASTTPSPPRARTDAPGSRSPASRTAPACALVTTSEALPGAPKPAICAATSAGTRDALFVA